MGWSSDIVIWMLFLTWILRESFDFEHRRKADDVVIQVESLTLLVSYSDRDVLSVSKYELFAQGVRIPITSVRVQAGLEVELLGANFDGKC